MAKPESNDKESVVSDQRKKKMKGSLGSSPFFVFVDYLFLCIFFCFLSFILYKMLGF